MAALPIPLGPLGGLTSLAGLYKMFYLHDAKKKLKNSKKK